MPFVKNFKYLLLLIAIPFSALAQDTTTLIKQANRFDFIAAQVMLAIYVGLNVYFICQAMN